MDSIYIKLFWKIILFKDKRWRLPLINVHEILLQEAKINTMPSIIVVMASLKDNNSIC